MSTQSRNDEAMLNYLVGEEAVTAAADEIWTVSGRLVDAQGDLEVATDRYRAAVADAGIPLKHVERIGAALILRLNRKRLIEEVERADEEDRDTRE
ncbi:hypothetical protein KGQ19_11145 [Catenulispora sp. NL8]|uniref:Uncharacterized protein n=1 Tax=Catenulispora pinistramenti TaxID=2705254 RepID=A0ABS5KN29_9ACTN|nr:MULTISPECIES: hypothetical protein [Catenulispora]MBS2547427.1 hypothetical protein [Catenulispora pinistramenti]